MNTKTKAPAKAKSTAKPPKGQKAADAVVTTPAAEAPAAATPAAAPVEAPKDQHNGITRPKAGSICANIWEACDALRAAGTKIAFAGIKEKLPKVNDSTIRTHIQRNKAYAG